MTPMQQSETLPAFVDLNVLPEELHPRYYSILFMVGIVALMAISLALIPLYQTERAARNETAHLQAELDLISPDLTLVQIPLGKARELQRQLEGVQTDLASLNEERQATLGGGQELSQDLSVVVFNLPPNVALASVTGSEGQMTISGQVLTSEDVLGYVSTLQESGRFSEARIVSLTAATVKTESWGVMFTIEAVQ